MLCFLWQTALVSWFDAVCIIFIWSQKYFLYSPKIKRFKQPVPVKRRFVCYPVSYWCIMCSSCLQRSQIERSHVTFFPADVSVVVRGPVRGASGCFEKYVLVEGLAKSAWPNKDTVDVPFFPPLLLLFVHRPDLEVCSDFHFDVSVQNEINRLLFVFILGSRVTQLKLLF